MKKNTGKTNTPTSPTPVSPRAARPTEVSPPHRAALIKALEDMPEEAFGWFVAWAGGVMMQYPDGLGGFSNESRAAIVALRAAANAYREPR